jgi:hypothetical protein
MRRLLTAVRTLCCIFALALIAAGSARAENELFDLDDHAAAKLQAAIFRVSPSDLQPPNGVGPGAQNRTQCVTAGEPGSIPGIDKDISCDDPISPDNELAIAVNPADPNMLLAGSNDYQINFLGNTAVVEVPSGFFFSRDGGATWIDGQLPLKGSLGGGDPAPAFDVKHHQLVFASLSFVCGQGAPVCSRGNVMFASADYSKFPANGTPNITWSDREIANGNSSDVAAQQIFLDKEWIAVDNNASSPQYGNIYVTFSRFRIEKGAYDESPIWFTASYDGGKQWTEPKEISGRNPGYCTFQDDPDDTEDDRGPNSDQGTAEGPDDPFACDQDQASIPVVAPDGTLYVGFQNEQNSQAYEPPQRYDSQYMIVKSDNGGQTFEGEPPTAANQAGCVRVQGAAAGKPRPGFPTPCIVPVHVVNAEDSYDNADHGPGNSIPDYPINVDGRTTLTGHQFRVWGVGNWAVAHTAGAPASQYRVYLSFSDNITGTRPAPGQTQADDPTFVPITDNSVYVAYSDNGGTCWVPPCGGGGDTVGNSNLATRIRVPSPLGAAPDDQIDSWFPWLATDPNTGAASVGFMDGSVDGSVRRDYGYALSTSQQLALGVAPVFAASTFMSGAPSNPNDSLFFPRKCTPESPTATCSAFIGDYNGLAIGSDSRIHGVWTDMRRALSATVNARFEDAYYAQRPVTP